VDKKNSRVQLPSDLTALSDEQLKKLEEDALAEFDQNVDSQDGDPDERLGRAGELADIIDAARAENGRRVEVAAERAAQTAALRERVRPPEPEPAEAEVEVVVPEAVPVPVGGAQVAATTVAPTNKVVDTLLAGGTLPAAPRKLNPTLADIKAQQDRIAQAPRRREQVLLASAEIPGFAQGSQLSDMDALVAAMSARARTLPVTTKGLEAPWYPVAGLQLNHRFTLDMRSTPDEMNEILTAATDVDALVAAGGWCAPSEISYDFYNIVCEDGILDLPTVGVNRGGIRFPTSASYGDIVNNFWAWNETQDIAAATGTGQSGTKTCFRVPCPGFNEVRLHCDGLCVTVGNLMEDAFPELIANHMRLTNAGFAHRLNQLRINTLIDPTYSTAVTGYGTAGAGLVAPVLGSLELTAIDYREKYRMCNDAVLEVVLPRWLRGAMRSDLRKRMGVGMEFQTVTDAQLMNMFDLLNIRVQWVTDWQVGTAGLPGGSTPLTLWPTTVQFLMFAAGTFVLGRGLQLNLGVIRDSVLNQTNDHTGAWQEECWLIAKVGHESRLGTIAICTDGTTGAADLTACGV
jgi:hypothetical protein